MAPGTSDAAGGGSPAPQHVLCDAYTKSVKLGLSELKIFCCLRDEGHISNVSVLFAVCVCDNSLFSFLEKHFFGRHTVIRSKRFPTTCTHKVNRAKCHTFVP